MFLAYVDESQCGNRFFVGGVVLPAMQTSRWNVLATLAVQTFGTSAPSRATEFHGADIVGGHNNFLGMPPPRRAKILERIAGDVMGLCDAGFPTFRMLRLDLAAFDGSTYGIGQEVRFTPYVYAVCLLLSLSIGHGASPLLVTADYNQPELEILGKSLDAMRSSVAAVAYGMPTGETLIDAVHFVHSHHSRLLQLADVLLYMGQRYNHLQTLPVSMDWERPAFEGWKALAHELGNFVHRWPEDFILPDGTRMA